MNCKLGKVKLNYLKILLGSGESYSIVLGKDTQICEKTDHAGHQENQGGEFQTRHQRKVEIVLLELDATKSITWNFYVDELHRNHTYNTLLGRDILFELQICLCFSNNKIRGNGGAYEGYTSPMKEVTNMT